MIRFTRLRTALGLATMIAGSTLPIFSQQQQNPTPVSPTPPGNTGTPTIPGRNTIPGTQTPTPTNPNDQMNRFPEQPRPKPVVVPGPVNVSIQEWTVPTLGSRPHDPEPGPGGTIWWTGMFANVLGRFHARKPTPIPRAASASSSVRTRACSRMRA